ncbi:hypothetical protein UUU_28160 [Klebsiella pneumoniae subsp. pneumoniae DSM 30104 = JCM 1662 = NBRC 14940]|nr:hypothetical protein UUU_28160 [Klebsiella pneumoniae subsp. pneumoniae DSM 30104 = JCM 1662 = NBRC 14940]
MNSHLVRQFLKRRESGQRQPKIKLDCDHVSALNISLACMKM